MSDLFKYDVHVRARLLESGEVTEEEVAKRLASLPDVSDRCDTVELQQPAIGRGSAQASNDDVADDDEDDDAGDERVTEKGGPTPSALHASEVAFDAAAEGFDDPDLPESDFSHFVLSLQHMALVHLGDAPNPTDDQRAVDLLLARHNIDLVSLLAQKTRGNLTGEEEHLLHQALYDLRMRFVEVAKTK